MQSADAQQKSYVSKRQAACEGAGSARSVLEETNRKMQEELVSQHDLRMQVAVYGDRDIAMPNPRRYLIGLLRTELVQVQRLKTDNGKLHSRVEQLLDSAKPSSTSLHDSKIASGRPPRAPAQAGVDIDDDIAPLSLSSRCNVCLSARCVCGRESLYFIKA